MNWILRLLLLLPLVASAQVEVRRYATMSDLLSANPTSFAVAGRATVVVTGRTNLYDGWSRVLAYSSSDTNTADSQTIFSPANTNFPGRYRLLYLENATNSAIRAGILPAYGANSFWYNGAWTPVSNIFVAGANSTVSVATNGVVTIASASGGEIILPVDAARITNGILSSSQAKGSDISWSVEAGTNVVATLYGSTVTFDKMQSTDPATLLGGVEGGVSQVPISPIQIGANLQMIGDTLSAIVPASTNSWQIKVGGVLTIEPDLIDTGRIDVTASGSSISFDLISGSVTTNYLSTGVNSLLHAHNLSFTVNGTDVVDPNLQNSSEITASVSASTNVSLSLATGSVALNKLVSIGASQLIGRGTSGTGAAEPVTVGTGLVLGTNGVLSATGTNATVVRVGGTTVTNPNFLDTSEVDMSIDLATNISASLFNNSVVFSKLQQIGTSRLLGRSTAGSGDIEQILIGSGLSLTSGTLSATGGGGGTSVYVDGVSVSGPNFSDAATTGLFDVSGTNVTIRLPDRDFGDISVGSSGASMTIDADSVALGTDTTGNYIATVAGTANEVTVSGSGSETAAVTVSLPSTIDLGGKTSFEVPNSTGPTTDAVGEIAVDSNAWASGRGALQIFDGTANTFAVGVLASDTPTNGQVPKWNTGGTITWEDDASTSGGATNVGSLLQVKGIATFSVIDSGVLETMTGLATSGNITNLTFDDGSSEAGLEERGLFTVYISPAMPDTSYVPIIEIEAEDPTGLGSPIGTVVYDSKTTSGFQFTARFTANEAVPVSRYRVWILDDDAVGSGSSSGTVTSVGLSTSLSGLSVGSTPVTSSGTISLSGTLGLASGGTGSTNAAGALAAIGGQASDSDLSALASAGSTGTGAFVRADSPTVSGTWVFDTLQLGTLTILTNLFVPADAYGSGWDGSSNAPAKNDVYDQMELRALKDVATTVSYASTITPSLGSTGANLILNVGAFTNNVTFANPTGTPVDGQSILMRMSQNATGGYSVTWGTNYVFGTDVTAALIPTAASASWEMVWIYNASATKWRAMAISRGF